MSRDLAPPFDHERLHRISRKLASVVPETVRPMNHAPEVPRRIGIGLIERDGSFLIRQRLEGQAMAGYWEFPGGKSEVGEEPSETARRECLEEAGVEVEVGELFYRVVHRYPHGLVELHYFRCTIAEKEVEPSANSGFRWVAASDLPSYRFPEANDVVIERLTRVDDQSSGSLRV